MLDRRSSNPLQFPKATRKRQCCSETPNYPRPLCMVIWGPAAKEGVCQQEDASACATTRSRCMELASQEPQQYHLVLTRC